MVGLVEMIEGIERIARGDFTKKLLDDSSDDMGNLAGAYNRMVDSLRRRELQYKRSQTFLQNVIDSSVDGIIATDMKGEIIIFNQGAERMLGYKGAEVLGNIHITDLYPPGVAKEIMRHLRSDEFGGAGQLEKVEARLINKNGEPIPVYISAAVVYEGKEEVASVGIFTDLRERRRLEDQLIRSEKLSSLGGLAAGIAHELNQPLTGILTFTHLLLKRFREDQVVRRDLEIIERETNRCARIIRGVLGFAREKPPEKVPQDLNDLVEHTLSMVERQALFLDVEVVRELRPDIPQVMIDPDQMVQVTMNLLINAADALAAGGGTLWVRTRKIDDAVELQIEDTGVGIQEQDVVKVFDPLYSTKDEKTRIGLGLAVSYVIVKAHQGEIHVQSQIGKGSSFTVRLPIKPDDGKSN